MLKNNTDIDYIFNLLKGQVSADYSKRIKEITDNYQSQEVYDIIKNQREELHKIGKNKRIPIPDSNGKVKQWRVYKKINLDIRNVIKNEAYNAQEENFNNNNFDLISIPAHSGARELCAKDQGKIYSRSNQTGTYTDYDGTSGKFYPYNITSFGQMAGLFGVNCRHAQYAFTPKRVTYSGESPEINTNVPPTAKKAPKNTKTQQEYQREIYDASKLDKYIDSSVASRKRFADIINTLPKNIEVEDLLERSLKFRGKISISFKNNQDVSSYGINGLNMVTKIKGVPLDPEDIAFTLLHELGHASEDSKLGKKFMELYGKRKVITQTVHKQKYKRDSWIPQIIKTDFSKLARGIKDRDHLRSIFKEMDELERAKIMSIMDTADALTVGGAMKKYGVGHGAQYYSKTNFTGQFAEMYTHYITLTKIDVVNGKKGKYLLYFEEIVPDDILELMKEGVKG